MKCKIRYSTDNTIMWSSVVGAMKWKKNRNSLRAMITLWSFVGFAAGRLTRLLHDYIVKTMGLFDNDNIMQIKCDNSILSSDYVFFLRPLVVVWMLYVEQLSISLYYIFRYGLYNSCKASNRQVLLYQWRTMKWLEWDTIKSTRK